jgi:pteridine reductase
MEVNLKSRAALVTGGAKRIGRAICLRLAAEGVNVAFSYRTSVSEAQETLAALRGLGIEAAALEADLSAPGDWDSLIDEATGALGSIDILVNNASGFLPTPLESLAEDRASFLRVFDDLVKIHMQAPLYLGLRLGLQMKKKGWGRIINITDRVAQSGQAYKDWSMYLATKYGLRGVTQALAEELAPEVCVNSVAPGLVVPPEWFPREKVQRLIDRIPLRSSAGPEEIAEDVLHLVRSRAKTGSAIVTDGGVSMHSL